MFNKQNTQTTQSNQFTIIEKLRKVQLPKEEGFCVDKNEILLRFINECSNWKNKIKSKNKKIISVKTTIKNLEINHSLFMAFFAITVVFSLIYLLVLTPLSLLGLVLKAPIWWLGIGTSLIGAGIGGLAIKSKIYLSQKKQELNSIHEEKKHLKFLISKKNIIQLLLNYDKLYQLNMTTLSRKEHLNLIQKEIWKYPLFEEQIEHLEQALQYKKHRLDIPQVLIKKIQLGFFNYLSSI